jgi:HAD superfamily hydrolase (TIGR01549 family)
VTDAITGVAGYAAVIFDMDGTLFDSACVVPDAYIETVMECGGRRYERAQIIEAYPIGPPAALLAHLLGRACREDELVRYHERLLALGGGVRVYDGMLDALSVLAAHVPLAVVTGASARAAEILLEAAELARYFHVVVGGDEIEAPKPDPAGVRLACHRLGVGPAQAAYVGDADVDLEAARRAGAVALAAGWGHLYREDHDADLVLREPGELLAGLPR